ncbi:NAD dependent epimerase/dehydratase [Mycobacteroides abscessus subsp. bolletii]|nr:NAD dependent epimerase/dehydratase [Mycobacteroides abscessus subsp. bolletii]
MAHITIIGGHGKVTLLAHPLLVAAGHTVTALIRNPDQAADVQAAGANPVVADIQSLSTQQITDLLTEYSTDVLVWSAGAGGGNPERTYAVDRDAAIRSMDAAVAAGVKRYIMVSYMGASSDHGVDPNNSFYAYAEAKAAADEHLRASSMDWTLLGPGMLTDGEAGDISVEVVTDGNRDVPRATVAAVLVAAIGDDSTIGKALPFHAGSTAIRRAVAEAPAVTSLA